MNQTQFIDRLCKVSFEDAFNPYSDTCPIFDLKGAPKVRREILSRILNVASYDGVDSVWIGRDLGYRGGRRTGLALTDQTHFRTHLERWSISETRKIVRGEAQSERTATAIWEKLDLVKERVFLWNVFPLHPHAPDVPLSNRSHTSRERDLGEEVLAALIDLLRPRKIIAIGQDALRSASRCTKIEVTPVRHPSYGGLKEFSSAMSEKYGI